MSRKVRQETELRQRSKVPVSLILVVFLVPLTFLPNFNDPFNFPKSLILSTLAFWIFGNLIFRIKSMWLINSMRHIMVITSIFLMTLFVSFLMSDNKFISFFGEYGRNSGLLSYFCLSIVLLSSAFYLNFSNIRVIQISLLIIGLSISLYSISQHFKLDFVNWINPNGNVISTLGNQNFVSAVLSIILIIVIGMIMVPEKNQGVKIGCFIYSFTSVFAIYFSKSIQGILVSLFGIFIFTFYYLYSKKKLIGWTFGILVISLGITILMGMIKAGPLQNLFYKDSITYRGDYWRTAWRMFLNNPWFGVGLDRFGANFREYRDLIQALRRGPNQISTAVHNVPLQMAATGGILLFIGYMLLVSYIFWRGIKNLRSIQGRSRITFISFFCAWIGFQLQSFVSIDNLGVAVFGYLLGGAIIALSDNEFKSLEKIKIINTRIISAIFSIFVLILSVPIIKSEILMNRINQLTPPNNQLEAINQKNIIESQLKTIYKNPRIDLLSANKLILLGFSNESIKILNDVIKKDPKNYDARNMLAFIFETDGKLPKSITIRKYIEKTDHYNYINMLDLALDYKTMGNLKEAARIGHRILQLAPNSDEASRVRKENIV